MAGQPTLSDVHVNQPLTNILIAYLQPDDAFVANQVAPEIPVQKQSDRYYEYLRDAFFRTDVKKRAPGTESSGTGWTLQNSSTYSCDVYAIHDDIPDQTRANADSPLQLEADSTYLVGQQLKIDREVQWLNTFFTTSIWSGVDGTVGHDMAGVTSSPGTRQFLRWDQAGSTPIEDVTTQRRNIQQRTGFLPNKLVLGPYVFDQLRNNPEIIDRVKYSERALFNGQVAKDLLAQAFGVDQVLVAEGVQNTATEGATFNPSFIFGKHALLCYTAPNPGIRVPSAMYTFCWQGYLAGTSNAVITSFYMPRFKSTRIEGETAFALKVIGTDLGVFFQNCVS